MIVYGKAIKEDIERSLKEEVRSRVKPPLLFILTVGSNPVTEMFINVKKRFAQAIGVPVVDFRFPRAARENDVKEAILLMSRKENAGIIVQLPLPAHLNTEEILSVIPETHDVDVLGKEALARFENDTLSILPPVIGAMKEILLRNHVFLGNKKVVVVGRGRLVGAPAATWFKRHEAHVQVLGRDTRGITPLTKDADIIVLGAGSPGLLKPEMIRTGAVILDAGVSESEGPTGREVAGDADSQCAEKAGIFTPVPGGIGPVAVAFIFKNLLKLTQAKENARH